MKTVINFGGFYESYHSMNIDSIIEGYIENENYSNNTNKNVSLFYFGDYNFNYKAMHKEYIQAYALVFSDYIKDNYNLNITFNNLSLNSPREYNFATDSIDCEISQSDYHSLKLMFINNNEFNEYLKERTKSYDGYRSYYTYETALNNNEILSQFILDYIIHKSNEDYPFYMDNSNIYELEVILDSDIAYA